MSKRTEGEVDFVSARGERVGLRLANAGRPTVWRNGTERDWNQRWSLSAKDLAQLEAGGGPKP